MTSDAPNQTPSSDAVAAPTHVVILLDRSGSMASIANDVIGGVNTLFSEQRANGSDARISLIQFDTQDPQDVIAWGAPVAEIADLDGRTFQPRGGTPLLDATGLAIGRVMVDQQSRIATGLQAEDIIFITVTDGEENSSNEYTLDRVKELIEARKAEGWTFTYLSAGLDAYADAAQLGIDVGNTISFVPNSKNATLLFSVASRGIGELRDKKRRGVRGAETDFFASGKDTENTDPFN